MSEDKLLIVYNADEGWSASLMDAVHKVIKPSTYQCSLCMIDHGALTIRKPWKKYLEDRPEEKLFFHRQDFERAYPKQAGTPLPVIMLDRGGKVEMMLDNKALDQLGDVDNLIAAMEQAFTRLTAPDTTEPAS